MDLARGKYDLVFVKNVDIVVLVYRADYNIRGLSLIPCLPFSCHPQNNDHYQEDNGDIPAYLADSPEGTLKSGQGPIYADQGQ